MKGPASLVILVEMVKYACVCGRNSCSPTQDSCELGQKIRQLPFLQTCYNPFFLSLLVFLLCGSGFALLSRALASDRNNETRRLNVLVICKNWSKRLPMPKSQQLRARSQHPPTQWNLRGSILYIKKTLSVL
jgi:hypothetical protein